MFSMTPAQSWTLILMLVILTWMFTWLVVAPTSGRLYFFGTEPKLIQPALAEQTPASVIDPALEQTRSSQPLFDWAEHLDENGQLISRDPADEDPALVRHLDSWNQVFAQNTGKQTAQITALAVVTDISAHPRSSRAGR